MDSTWIIAYRHEHDQLLLGRLRWCAGLSLLGAILLGAGVGGVPDQAPSRLPFELGYAAVSLATWAVARLPTIQRHVTLAAIGYVMALIVVMALQYTSIPADASLAPVGFVATTLGVTVLLPWGLEPQLVVALASVAGFAWVFASVPAIRSGGGTAVVLSAAAVSVAAANLIERYRATSFERAWQQEHLLSLARTLAARTGVDEIIRGVLDYGLRLVAADLVIVAGRDAARGVYRIQALDGPSVREAQSFVGVEFPEDFPGTEQILERDTLVLPDEEPANPIEKMLTQSGYRSVVYAAMRHEGGVIGILSFVRKQLPVFTPGERALVRGLADQAAIALRTARLIADLRQANQMKSEFLSTMSHELRTPLNVILGYAEMVAQRTFDAADRHGMLTQIQTAARELLELIENTLEIGKLEAGRSEVRLEMVWLPGFWSILERGCVQMPRARDVALQWDAAVPEIGLRTDPRKLTVAVRNLVGNALKFTEHGFVRVQAAVEDGHVAVRVADTGIGIPVEDQDRIFEMFRQGDGSDTRRFGGAGLGLYLVRQFAGQLGGTLALDSAPGQGSVFTLSLPLQTRDTAPFGN